MYGTTATIPASARQRCGKFRFGKRFGRTLDISSGSFARNDTKSTAATTAPSEPRTSPPRSARLAMLPIISTDATAARECSPCTACCTMLPMPAGVLGPGSKPAGTPCRHQTAGGCRAYGLRPQACRDFRCAWLADESWPVHWRPDRSGLLCLREEMAEGMTAAAVYEIQPGALTRPTGRNILSSLNDSCVAVAVIDASGQRQSYYAGQTPLPHGQQRPTAEPARRDVA